MSANRPAGGPATDDDGLTRQIREGLGRIEARIVAAGGTIGAPDGVAVVGVTKFHPASTCAASISLGLIDLGESFARELADKFDQVPGARWHFIGQLQTNKVRVVAGRVALYHSVDRDSLVAELARRDPGARILIQVDLAAGEGRGGCRPEAVEALVDLARESGLIVDGVMGVGPRAAAPVVGAAFARLRSICDAHGLAVCSMGMSEDLELAVAEGSTMVRVGTAIFGPRP